MFWQPPRFCNQCGHSLVSRAGVLYCQPCGLDFHLNPVPAVAMLATGEDGRILLIKRRQEPKAGWWALPGGFVEFEESPAGSARREFLEETGLTAGEVVLRGAETEISRRYGRVLVLCYRIIDFTGNLRAGDDAEEASFFPPLQLPELAFSSHAGFLRRELAGS